MNCRPNATAPLARRPVVCHSVPALTWLARRRGLMGGIACGFALANAGHDTRALQAYLGHRNI
jgi:hypothetical protein